MHHSRSQSFLYAVTEPFAYTTDDIVHVISGLLLMSPDASVRMDHCWYDTVSFIVIHTGTHHAGAVIHPRKCYRIYLVEIYAHESLPPKT